MAILIASIDRGLEGSIKLGAVLRKLQCRLDNHLTLEKEDQVSYSSCMSVICSAWMLPGGLTT